MAVSWIVVTGDLADPDGNPAGGVAMFTLSEPFANAGQMVDARISQAIISDGALTQPLAANNDAGSEPGGSRYWVALSLSGAPFRSGYISVPSAPAGSRAVTDGAVTAGSADLASASAAFTDADIGVYVWCAPFPVGSTIISVSGPTQAVLSAAAVETAGGLSALIGASVDLSTLWQG